MDKNLISILKQFEELKGQHIIINSSVQRLISIGTDQEDYYWVTYNGKETTWSSCIIEIVPLKEKIDNKHYNEFVRLAKINDYDQSTLWGNNPVDIVKNSLEEQLTCSQQSIQHKEKMEALKLPDRFLSTVCWDLN